MAVNNQNQKPQTSEIEKPYVIVCIEFGTLGRFRRNFIDKKFFNVGVFF